MSRENKDPMTPRKNKTELVVLTIRLEKPLLDRLRKLQAKLGIYSFSGVLRYILHKHLSEEEK